MKVATLVRKLQSDVKCYQKDDFVTPYKVTENVKVAARNASRHWTKCFFLFVQDTGAYIFLCVIELESTAPGVQTILGVLQGTI